MDGPITNNLIYPKARLTMMSGSGAANPLPNLGGAAVVDTILVALMSSSYLDPTNDASGDQFWNDISANLLAGCTPQELTGKTITIDTTPGVMPYPVALSSSAGSITFSGVTPSGNTCTSVVVYIEGASAGVDDHLLALYVSSSGTGIDILTNDGDITINWDTQGILGLTCT